ncbi:MAG: endonuclease NucS [Acidimicrobiaceae bacterium]|nr:endonuclease NucS [Acidimicrobiaceae bacterium]
MAVEMAIWRMTDDRPHPLVSSPLDSEQRLEDMIAEDPRMIGTDLLIIARQIPTGFGEFIDLLALDAEGRVHVLELKRDRTPRDVVAQALDYGSWAKDLSLEDLEQIHQDSGDGETRLDEAFAEHFGGPLPDGAGAEQQFTIVASELDPTSDRIIGFPAEPDDVPINAVLFRRFADGDHEHLAPTAEQPSPQRCALR